MVLGLIFRLSSLEFSSPRQGSASDEKHGTGPVRTSLGDPVSRQQLLALAWEVRKHHGHARHFSLGVPDRDSSET